MLRMPIGNVDAARMSKSRLNERHLEGRSPAVPLAFTADTPVEHVELWASRFFEHAELSPLATKAINCEIDPVLLLRALVWHACSNTGERTLRELLAAYAGAQAAK